MITMAVICGLLAGFSALLNEAKPTALFGFAAVALLAMRLLP
jgi:hypothetical protein